jgi:DNA-directed RNA polymerase specialized sigma24 family protein
MVDNKSTKKDSESIDKQDEVNKENSSSLNLTPAEIMERLGRTKKRILIEIYRDSVGYKRLSKIIGVGLDTIRSHIRTGKYSRSLLEMNMVERGEKGWQLTSLGLQVTELLQQDNEFKAFFFE